MEDAYNMIIYSVKLRGVRGRERESDCEGQGKGVGRGLRIVGSAPRINRYLYGASPHSASRLAPMPRPSDPNNNYYALQNTAVRRAAQPVKLCYIQWSKSDPTVPRAIDICLLPISASLSLLCFCIPSILLLSCALDLPICRARLPLHRSVKRPVSTARDFPRTRGPEPCNNSKWNREC